MTKTSETHPIAVQFVSPSEQSEIRLGMTFCPGKIQRYSMSGPWHRDLSKDLIRLKTTYNVKQMVCCVEPHELEALRVVAMAEECSKLNISLHFLPIVDVSIPSEDTIQKLIRLAPTLLKSNSLRGFTVIFCKGGLGRTGLVSACLLQLLGTTPKKSIELVRHARPGAIETKEQESFVLDFHNRIEGLIGPIRSTKSTN